MVKQNCDGQNWFQFQLERLAASALNIVPMEMCIQDTIEYTKARMAFGQPLINNQVFKTVLSLDFI